MKIKIKSGDRVQVICGDDAGPEPRKVLEIVDDGAKVLVEGVNRVYKHVKKGHPKSPAGGRLSMEMPVAISNVLLYCDTCAKGVRVGAKYLDDGSKVRFCKKCGNDLGKVSPAKARYAKKA
jgi:large subunit ribosomal protein L24